MMMSWYVTTCMNVSKADTLSAIHIWFPLCQYPWVTLTWPPPSSHQRHLQGSPSFMDWGLSSAQVGQDPCSWNHGQYWPTVSFIVHVLCLLWFSPQDFHCSAISRSSAVSLLRSSGTFCSTWAGRLRLSCLARWVRSLALRYSVSALGLWQYGWYVLVKAWEISQVYKVVQGVCRFCATMTRLTQELRLRVWGRYCYSLK